MTQTITEESTATRLDLSDPDTLKLVQRQYEEAIPRVRAHAEIKFRGVRDPGARDDFIENAIDLGWMEWLSSIRHGNDPNTFISSIADKAVKRAWRRWPQGQERAKEVLSPYAQRVKGFSVEQLPPSAGRTHAELYADPHGQERVDAIEERLADNTVSSPLQQAEFREQWRMLMDKQTGVKRPIVSELAGGADTKDVARQFGKTPGRISQIRREVEIDWNRIDRLGDDEERSR